MTIVAGVDFGTLSVRVSILDSERGRLGTAVPSILCIANARTPITRRSPTQITCAALAEATREAVKAAAIGGDQVAAIALDTTGSSVVPVDAQMQPLERVLPLVRPSRQSGGAGDHRARAQRKPRSHRLVRRRLFARVGICQAAALAAPQSRKARAVRFGLRALRHGCGNLMRHHRSPTGEAQRLRHGPQVDVESKVGRAAAAVVLVESRSADGWHSRQSSPASISPPITSPVILRLKWAEKLGLRAGIPIPVGAFDAHWDAMGAGCREGDVVNVVGTSTCIIAMAHRDAADSRRLRRGAGQRASAIHRHRSRACRRPATSSKPLRDAPA